MKLSVRGVALTMGFLWATCMLLVGIVNLVTPNYGSDFLQMMSSIYPGFHNSRTLTSVLIGTVWGFIDGAVGGWIFASIYDWITGRRRAIHRPV